MQKLHDITHNAVIPIGVVCSLLTSIIVIVWMASTVNAQVNSLVDNDSPSRTEFKTLCDTVNNTNARVNDIYDYLLKK
jgi:hypothetical protein